MIAAHFVGDQFSCTPGCGGTNLHSCKLVKHSCIGIPQSNTAPGLLTNSSFNTERMLMLDNKWSVVKANVNRKPEVQHRPSYMYSGGLFHTE